MELHAFVNYRLTLTGWSSDHDELSDKIIHVNTPADSLKVNSFIINSHQRLFNCTVHTACIPHTAITVHQNFLDNTVWGNQINANSTRFYLATKVTYWLCIYLYAQTQHSEVYLNLENHWSKMIQQNRLILRPQISYRPMKNSICKSTHKNCQTYSKMFGTVLKFLRN
jgi:hypothetical protein